MSEKTTRRNALKKLAAGSLAAGSIASLSSFTESTMENSKLKGNINHSVCQWSYGFIPLEELCIEVKKLGLSAIDLIAPKDWPILQKHGIHCSMCYTAGKIRPSCHLINRSKNLPQRMKAKAIILLPDSEIS